jgi:biopolymer transport protein ExbB/TolQ
MIETLPAALSNSLYQVSTALLLPVMAVVLALLAVVLLALGGFLRECWERRRVQAALRNAVALVELPHPDAPAAWKALAAARAGWPQRLVRLASGRERRPAALQKAFLDVETEISDHLGRLAFLARVGPMLGLLGTLIPFGPALAGLSSGDIQELSANLVTAFATTVVGLLCGCAAFGLGLVRRSWYARDFDNLEYLLQLMTESKTHDQPQTAEMECDGRRADGRLGQLV